MVPGVIMLQITPHHKILLAIAPIDFRKGIDSLVAVCKKYFACDPMNGTVFVFTNRRRISVKLLVYDGNGFWLCQKRFSSGKLKWWPATQEQALHLQVSELHVILAQGIPTQIKIPKNWHEIT
jgi:transposase